MIVDIGLVTLLLVFLFSMYATFASLYGGWKERPTWVESARNAALLVFPLLTVSVLIIVYSLYQYFRQK